LPVPFPALITLIAPLALAGYTLTRTRHSEMLAEIEQRRAAGVLLDAVP
jgi:Na+/melibiose symporter-like transporter